MTTLRQAIQRIRSVFRYKQSDEEASREMSSHIAIATDENMAKGMSAGAARRQALIAFGGVEQAREQRHAAASIPALEILVQDLRYTLRTLHRDAGFATIAVLILALGIGANVVVFSVVNTLLFRPLPVEDPQHLAWMQVADAKGLSGSTYSIDAYTTFLQQNRSFSDIAAYNPFYGTNDFKLTGHGEPQPLSGVGVTGNFFSVLGLQPALGRLFTPQDAIHGTAPTVVLSNPYWRRQFHSDPNLAGQSITLNNKPFTVAGVLSASFDFSSIFDPASHMDVFYPAVLEDMRDDGNELFLVGRLRPGVTLAAAQAEASIITPHLLFSLKHPAWGGDYGTAVTGLQDHVSGKLRRSLLVLWSAVGMILLIVCVNLANLLLARAAAREKEFALRTALGAGRFRLIRQMATESLVLATLGGILGLALAYIGTAWLAHQGSLSLPLLSSVSVDAKALGWTVAIVLAASVLFGILPALRVAGSNLQDSLKDGSRAGGDGRRHERVRSALVISEVALACVLLVCAGLLLRSFMRVLDVDLGFEPIHSAALKIDYDLTLDNESVKDLRNLPRPAFLARQTATLRQILNRVQAIPGIESAGIVDMLPLDRNRSWGFAPVGHTYPKGVHYGTFVYIATPGYLQSMGIRIREGRDLTWDDRPDTQPVVVINRAAARQMWPGEDALGKKVEIGGDTRTVVGIADDIRETGLEETASIESYLPVSQNYPEGSELVIRTKLPPATTATSVIRTLRELNPGQPATEFRTIQSLVDRSTSPRRFFAILVGSFAALGILLAALGIYGVISYSVTRRTQEIGIRMALGATLSRVRWDVLSGTLRLVLVGIAIGSLAAYAAAHGIASLLFGTQPGDPAIYGLIVLCLVAIAALAGYLPARKASKIDPMMTLRNN